MPQTFVTPERLQEHLEDPNVVIVDGSWYLPTQNRDPEAEYLAGHIPGAVRFDIDSVRDASSALPHMLPSPEEFARCVGAMGIGDDTIVVVYDGAGLFSAPRVRWTFRVFGARDVCDSRRRFSRMESGRPPDRERARTQPAAEAVHAAIRSQPRWRTPRRCATRSPAHRPRSRCPARRPLPRRGAGAAPRRARRPYAGQPQPAFRDDRRERKTEGQGRHREGAGRGRHRPGPTGHHELRLRRLGRDPVARAGDGRASGEGAL